MSKCTRCTYINYQITRHEQNNLRTYFHHQKQFSDHLFVHWSLLHPARQSKIPQMFASSFWWNWFLPQHMWGCEDGVQQEWGVWGPAVACSIVTFLRSVWHWNVESEVQQQVGAGGILQGRFYNAMSSVSIDTGTAYHYQKHDTFANPCNMEQLNHFW